MSRRRDRAPLGAEPGFGYARPHAPRGPDDGHDDAGRPRADRVAGVPIWIGWQHVAVAALVWVVLTAGSLAIVLRIALSLPVNYFEADQGRRPLWTARRIVRNAIGIVLVAVGAALSIPGVPGQGVLTILVGLFLVDFPRRQQLERTLASRQGVLTALNRLRARFGRPALRPPPGR